MFVRFPLAPLLAVYLLGILGAWYYTLSPWMLGLVILVLGLLIYFLQTVKKIPVSAFFLNGMLYLIIFAFANFQTQLQLPLHQSNHYSKVIKSFPSAAIVELTDWPVKRNQILTLPLQIRYVQNKQGPCQTQGRAMVKLKLHQRSKKLKPGDWICLELKPWHKLEVQHPDLFNYNAYLKKHHIEAIFWADTNWTVLKKTNAYTIQYWPEYQKNKWLQKLKTLQLSSSAYALCAALTCGYDDLISSEEMSAFSNSGTLHILSVSGLHVGLIYGLFLGILKIRGFLRRYPKWSFGITLVPLWLFILISGASAPALRAGIMCSGIAFGNLLFGPHRIVTLNILLGTAWLLLIWDSFLLFDVGFQLSFTAIFGLLTLQPVFNRVIKTQNRLVNYLWKGFTASFAATLVTLPLTLYYFKQFPLFFAVANVWAVPLCFIIMLLAIGAIALPGLLEPLINGIVAHLYDFLNVFNHPHWGYLDRLPFNTSDVVFLTLLLLLFYSIRFLNKPALWFLLPLLILIWQITALFQYQKEIQYTRIWIHSQKKSTAWALQYHSKAFVSEPFHSSLYRYVFKPLLVLHSIRDHEHTLYQGFQTGSETWFFKSNARQEPSNVKAITTLVLSKNALFDSAHAVQYSSLQNVLFTADNSENFMNQFERIYRRFGVKTERLATGTHEWKNLR